MRPEAQRDSSAHHIRTYLQDLLLTRQKHHVDRKLHSEGVYRLARSDPQPLAADMAELRKLPPGHGLTDEFMRPKSSQPAAYKEWYERKFLPTALKVELWEKQ